MGTTVRCARLQSSQSQRGANQLHSGTFVAPFTSILAETIYRGDYVRLTGYERNIFIEETSKLEM